VLDHSAGYEQWDVFVSHWSEDKEQVHPLVEALTAVGLSVWIDDSAIETHKSITRAVREGVARSKLLLAYYSETYPRRRACQWELTAAFIGAQRLGPVTDRIAVINPGPRTSHIQPVELRDAIFASVPTARRDPDTWKDEASCIAEMVSNVHGTLGTALAEPPRQIGRRLIGAPDFVGRLNEVWEIHSALSGSDTVLITGASGGDVAQLSGMGGIGKSLLAEEYALRFGAAYPGGVYWLSAAPDAGVTGQAAEEAQESAIGGALASIAAELGTVAEGRTPDELAGEIRKEIESADRSLWIVDALPINLSEQAVRRWIAPSPRARTLITTQSRQYHLAPRIDLTRLPSLDGYELLTRRITPSPGGEEDVAHTIVERLGGHPLALGIAGHILRQDAGLFTIAEFRDRLENPSEDALELAEHLRPQLPNGHNASIATTLLESLAVLGESALDLLRIASLLAATAIPKTTLVDVLGTLCEWDPERARSSVRDGIVELDAVSLIDDPSPERDVVVVHALVSRTIRFRYGTSERQAATLDVLLAFFADAMTQERPFSEYGVVLALLPHAREVVSRACADAPSRDGVRLRDAVAYFDKDRGDLDAAIAGRTIALGEYSSLFGSDSIEAQRAKIALADVLEAKGASRAAAVLAEDALNALSLMLGPQHGDTLDAQLTLGSIQRHDDLLAARTNLQTVLTARRAASPTDDHAILTVLSLLASVAHLQGEYGEARDRYALAAEASRRMYGKNHPTTAMMEIHQAAAMMHAGTPDGARRLAEDGVVVLRDILGAAHPHTLTCMNNLAVIASQEGSDEAARRLLEETVALNEQTSGPEAYQTLVSVDNLASMMRKLGDLDDAHNLGLRAVDGLKAILGDSHLDTLTAMGNLGTTLHARGEFDAEVPLVTEVMAGFEREVGPAHPKANTARHELANALLAAGDNLGAARVISRQVELEFGADSPEAQRSRDIFAQFEARERPPATPKVNRNSPCPCGSGKKYKRCCGK